MTACHRRIGGGAKPPLQRIWRGTATQGRGTRLCTPTAFSRREGSTALYAVRQQVG